MSSLFSLLHTLTPKKKLDLSLGLGLIPRPKTQINNETKKIWVSNLEITCTT